jgi:CheY-like chemotaxis protein
LGGRCANDINSLAEKAGAQSVSLQPLSLTLSAGEQIITLRCSFAILHLAKGSNTRCRADGCRICGRNETSALIRGKRSALARPGQDRERQGGRYACILVVDDDPHVGLAIRAWLAQRGFRVAIADGGTNGLVDNSTFDLMIVEMFMPNIHGFESIRLFHQRAPSVPLVAISGYAVSNLEISGADVQGMAAKLGATRCLRKPFRPTTLLNVIDQCLSEAEPHRRYVATLSAVASAISEAHRDALRG